MQYRVDIVFDLKFPTYYTRGKYSKSSLDVIDRFLEMATLSETMCNETSVTRG